MNQAQPNFDLLALDLLKSIGKTQSQMNLYSANHPAVAQMLAEAASMIGQLLQQTPQGEIAYTVDQEKVVANGRHIGNVDQVPGAVTAIFTRYKLESVTFRAGVVAKDLQAFCEMGALRKDVAQTLVPGDFLTERGVHTILVNETVYTKKGEEEEAAAAAQAPAADDQAEQEAFENFITAVKNQPLEKVIQRLVEQYTKDPGDQIRLLETILEKIQSDIQNRIKEATRELKGQKQAVENEASRTQGVIEGMADGVVTVDDTGKVLMMNPEAEGIFGMRLAEMAGKFVQESTKEEHMVTMAQDLAQMPQDRPIDKNAAVVANDDTKQTLRNSTVVIQNESGKTVGMVSSLSDIAKQRKLQRMEREFMAHVTHELRAPLSSIRAALEIISDISSGKMEAESHRMFQNALRNADRLENLINGILDFSKIESGQMTVAPTPVAPSKIAEEGVESLKPWAQKKGLNLDWSCAEGLPQVKADLPRTVQVVVNLLSNAIKFTPKGGRIAVKVGMGESDSKGRYVQFSVKDTGPGIAKEEQKKVFQKFVQIAAGERHVGGTGLGLSIAKALIHMQKGQMWLVSDVGRGAEFLFTLPEHVPPKDAAKPPPKKRSWWKRLFGLK